MAVMQEWAYQAVDPTGTNTVKGTMDAASESVVTGGHQATSGGSSGGGLGGLLGG